MSQAEAPAAATPTQYLASRDIPWPLSISEEARDALRTGAGMSAPASPPATDLQAWRDHVRAFDATLEPFVDRLAATADYLIEIERLGEVDIYVVRYQPDGATVEEKANLLLHGGAFVYCGGRCVVLPAAFAAMHYGGVVYVPDYRMPPDHPFPAAVDDCLAAYQWVLDRHHPSRVLASGESAGGNLAAATLFRARDAGLPMPRALFLNTPAVDLSFAGDSYHVNRGADVVLKGEGIDGPDLYVAGHDPKDPYVSPIYGDFRGFPPTYVRTGTRDLLLSDSVRIHAALRKAGTEADLYVGEAMPHGGFALFGTETREDADARSDFLRWLEKHW